MEVKQNDIFQCQSIDDLRKMALMQYHIIKEKDEKIQELEESLNIEEYEYDDNLNEESIKLLEELEKKDKYIEELINEKYNMLIRLNEIINFQFNKI